MVGRLKADRVIFKLNAYIIHRWVQNSNLLQALDSITLFEFPFRIKFQADIPR